MRDKRQQGDGGCCTDGLGVMPIQRVALLSVDDLGRESVQGGPLCLPLSFLSVSISSGQRVVPARGYDEDRPLLADSAPLYSQSVRQQTLRRLDSVVPGRYIRRQVNKNRTFLAAREIEFNIKLEYTNSNSSLLGASLSSAHGHYFCLSVGLCLLIILNTVALMCCTNFNSYYMAQPIIEIHSNRGPTDFQVFCGRNCGRKL